MIIEDGKGSGGLAKVRDNRLVTSSVTLTEEEVAIANGDAYIMDIDQVTVDTADYILAYIYNNDPSRDLVVSSLFLSAWENKDQNMLQISVGAALSSAANTSAVVPANRKSGCSNVALGTFYTNDGAGDLTTFTGEVVCGRYGRLVTEGKWFYSPGGWVIPYGASWNCGPSIGDTAYCGCINFYYRAKD